MEVVLVFNRELSWTTLFAHKPCQGQNQVSPPSPPTPPTPAPLPPPAPQMVTLGCTTEALQEGRRTFRLGTPLFGNIITSSSGVGAQPAWGVGGAPDLLSPFLLFLPTQIPQLLLPGPHLPLPLPLSPSPLPPPSPSPALSPPPLPRPSFLLLRRHH